MKQGLKQVRVFSEAVRRKVVKDIETGKVSIAAVCRELDVSKTSVYSWLNKYSRHLQSGKKLVLQMDSEAYKSKELEKRVKELEAALGRKQLEVDFLNRLIEQGKEELGGRLEKKVLHSTLRWFKGNKRQHGHKLRDVYEVAGISRQALHQHRIRELSKAKQAYEFFEQADKIREAHPRAGCRKMALDLRSKGWGRDKTEQFLLQSGYRINYPPNYKRTTYAQHHLHYPNLIEGLELNNINQLVQTDITYYRVGERFYYLVFLIDVYSRRIVGYALNKTLEAEGNIKALRMFFSCRGRCKYHWRYSA